MDQGHSSRNILTYAGCGVASFLGSVPAGPLPQLSTITLLPAAAMRALKAVMLRCGPQLSTLYPLKPDSRSSCTSAA